MAPSNQLPLDLRKGLGGEVVRMCLLIAAALILYSPFLVHSNTGGNDARWYAYMLADALGQLRAGHFPALVGEGRYAWNGGVHPFRSAPMYMMLGSAWDIVTWGHLGVNAIQHLVAATCAVSGAVGMYLVGICFLPGRRWMCMGFALLYLLTPAWIQIFVLSDAYMSFVAFGALPILIYGNLKTVLEEDGRGFGVLGVGLAVVWLCHPPIAMLSTILTVAVQCGNLLVHDKFPLGAAIRGAIWFALLDAWYFASMSEVPTQAGGGQASQILAVASLALGFVAVGSAFFKNGGWRSLAGAIVAVGVLAGLDWPWAVWLSVTAALAGSLSWILRRAKAKGLSGWAYEGLFLSGLVAAGVSHFIVHLPPTFEAARTIENLDVNARTLHAQLSPLGSLEVIRYGWGVGFFVLLGLIALLRTRSRGPVLFIGALTLLMLTMLRLPAVSEFMISYIPNAISSVAAFGFDLRNIPVISTFAVALGIAAVSVKADRGKWVSAGLVVMMLVALASSIQGALLFRDFEVRSADAEGLTSRNWRSENVPLSRYAYDLLPLPDYFSEGVLDPRLESRLISQSGEVLSGEAEAAAACETKGTRIISLVCTEVSKTSPWLRLSPRVTVGPGEQLMLRFEFSDATAYNGYLICTSENCYREYHLPASGRRLAFGSGKAMSHVLTLWNSGKTPENYQLDFDREQGCTLKPGDAFGRIVVSTFDIGLLPVAIESLRPYHGHVRATNPCLLETFRIYLPGYEARVDGNVVPVVNSPNGLAAFAVPAGTHEVELKFVGTTRIHLAEAVSLIAWLGLGLCSIGSRLRLPAIKRLRSALWPA